LFIQLYYMRNVNLIHHYVI